MSILKKILLPLLIVMTLQAALIFGSIVYGGALPQMRENVFNIFDEKVSNRTNILSTEMLRRWSRMDESMARVLSNTGEVLASENQNLKTLKFQDDLSGALLEAYTQDVLYLLRKNSVSGAFLVLDGNDLNKKGGIYFRDPDPTANPSNYSDLLAICAPSFLTKKYGIAMDSQWLPYFDFSDQTADDRAFYDKPFQAALDNPNSDFASLGYWGHPSLPLKGEGEKVITYSVPLLSQNGVPFGVLGVEISLDCVDNFLPFYELNGGANDGYLLAVGSRSAAEESRGYEVATATGGAYKNALVQSESVRFVPEGGNSDAFLLEQLPGLREDVYTSIRPVSLYATNTPFEDDRWVVVGLVAKKSLLSFIDHFRQQVVVLWLLATLIGVAGIVVVARLITLPIGHLAEKLRIAGPGAPISLERINIREIDELLDALESLSTQVADSALRLSKILGMTGVSIGAFEYSPAKSKYVFCTWEFFDLLEINPPTSGDGRITPEELDRCFYRLGDRMEEKSADDAAQIYRMGSAESPHWISVKRVTSEAGLLGVVTDVTQEMSARRRIEYDRDFDPLTNLFNRRAFQRHAMALFGAPEALKTAAMVMVDLDNLKFINDTYGHDYGDEYIRLTADVLRKYAGGRALVSRLSGDEFVVLFHGCNHRGEIQAACEAIKEGMRLTCIYLPDHTQMQIRASAGVAWYPDDAAQYEDLLRYADFAMYMVKKTHKGDFIDFDLNSYNEESYLLRCREELNTIIDEQLVEFQFQPIIDARTGEIHAFEALMRPQTENIKSPLALLSLARSQSKLAQIERMTFFRALERFIAQPMAQTECLLFVNSIANQIMTIKDVEEIERRYGPYLKRMVIELTEEERPEKNFMSRKESYAKKWGGGIALDDFGVGYNGEAMLLHIIPAYIKLDMSLVQNIHADADRLQIVRNLIVYCQERGIKVIAEGVETRADLAALIHAGVDYLQGYYLGKPTYAPDLVMVECRAEVLALNEHEAGV